MQKPELKPGQIQISLSMINSCILAEMRELSTAMAMPMFKNIWSGFENYNVYIRKKIKQRKNIYKPVLDASNGTYIVEINNDSPEMHMAYATAQIAACCELLAGNKIKHDKLNPIAFQQYIKNYISQLNAAPDIAKQNMMHRVHTMDAVRTMHLLRNLGLISKLPKHYYQLALGAGSGEKDIFSLHKFPEINKKTEAGNVFYKILMRQEDVAHVIISDPDPQRLNVYKTYNEERPVQVLALNEDSETVFGMFKQQSLKKRNLVTAIRLDHHMIPDPERFLKGLVHCLDEQSDLVFTIGSGNEPDEFEGRTRVLSELFELFEKARLRPVLFKFHGGGDTMGQYNSLRYGNAIASTYQILYCKIKKQELLKLFSRISDEPHEGVQNSVSTEQPS